MIFPELYAACEDSSRDRSVERPALRMSHSGTVVATVTLSGYKVGVDPSPADWAAHIEKALDAADANTAMLEALKLCAAYLGGLPPGGTPLDIAYRAAVSAIDKAGGR